MNDYTVLLEAEGFDAEEYLTSHGFNRDGFVPYWVDNNVVVIGRRGNSKSHVLTKLTYHLSGKGIDIYRFKIKINDNV